MSLFYIRNVLTCDLCWILCRTWNIAVDSQKDMFPLAKSCLFTKLNFQEKQWTKVQSTWTLTTHSSSCIVFKIPTADWLWAFIPIVPWPHVRNGIFWCWRRASISIYLIIYNTGLRWGRRSLTKRKGFISQASKYKYKYKYKANIQHGAEIWKGFT